MNDTLFLNEQNSYELIEEVIFYINKILARIEETKRILDDLEINNVWVCENAEYFKKKCIDGMNDMKTECYLTAETMKQLLNNVSEFQNVDEDVIKALNGELNI